MDNFEWDLVREKNKKEANTFFFLSDLMSGFTSLFLHKYLLFEKMVLFSSPFFAIVSPDAKCGRDFRSNNW